MPYTGQLGTDLSTPGNLLLGSIGLNLDQSFSDSLTYGETWVGGLLANEMVDELALEEVILYTVVWSRLLTDTLTLNDGFVNKFSDTLTLTETLEVAQIIFPHYGDSLTYSETMATQLTGSVSMIDGLNFFETNPRPHMHWYRAFTDTLTPSETMIGYISRDAVDTLTYTETPTFVKSYGFRDVLTLGDSLSKTAVLTRRMASFLEPYDSLTLSVFINKTITDSLSLTDTMVGNKNRPLIPDTLTYAEVMTGTQSKKLADTLTYTESIATTKSLASQFSDSLTLFETLRAQLTVDVTMDEFLALNETWSGIRNRFGTATDSLTYTDRMLREIIVTIFSNNLNYAETWTVTKHAVGNAHDTMIFTDTAGRLITVNESAADSLTYRDNFFIYKKGAGVKIRGAALTIILPAPEFNDFEANQNKMIVGRSMTGDFRTYVKRTDRERLNWRFILPQPKKDELMAFILAEINNTLIVDDFKGRRWSFKLLSDSFDFTEVGRWEPCGNKNEVTLEFEGQRYYG